MKKFLSTMLALVVMVPLAFMFVGCGVTGKYRVESATIGTETVTYESYKEKYGKDDYDYANASVLEKTSALVAVRVFAIRYELKKDGLIVLTPDYPKWAKNLDELKDFKVESDMKWEENEDKTITISGVTFTKDGRLLKSDNVVLKRV